MSVADDIEVFAHRGFSSRHPEMTLAAYRAAIELAAQHRTPLGLECDVQFSKDDQLVCLHDLGVERTSTASGAVFDRTLAELQQIDFGAHWRGPRVAGDGSVVTLSELFALTDEAIGRGVAILVNVETKHPNPRGFGVEDRVAQLLADRGWDGAESPVRLISFSPAALDHLAGLLPRMRRTYLIGGTLAPVLDGRLPEWAGIVGPDLALLREDPGFVERVRSHGHEVHAWTVNEYADIEFCLELGVSGITSDYPDRVFEVLQRGL